MIGLLVYYYNDRIIIKTILMIKAKLNIKIKNEIISYEKKYIQYKSFEMIRDLRNVRTLKIIPYFSDAIFYPN